MSAKEGWNIISESYQEHERISLEDVHYGPISPGESDLRLLGEVSGKDVLEAGCGGGQNTIVLSKWGARSVGLDISERQIKYAQQLAKKEGVSASFHVGNMEYMSVFQSESFDIVLSSFAVGYVANLQRAFQEVHRVLRKDGLFVFCAVHPIVIRGKAIRRRKGRAWVIRDYFNRRSNKWTWKTPKGKVATFYEHHRTVQDYFDMLRNTGFLVDRILEPKPYPLDKMSESNMERVPYLDENYVKDYDLWKRIPYTIIFKTIKL
jgi:ubiquinone/menaquinone biosynthesis C-methylase UbiE